MTDFSFPAVYYLLISYFPSSAVTNTDQEPRCCLITRSDYKHLLFALEMAVRGGNSQTLRIHKQHFKSLFSRIS